MKTIQGNSLPLWKLDTVLSVIVYLARIYVALDT